MKKRYFLIPLLGILCFFLVFALASCSKDDDTDGSDYEDKQNGWWSECLILNEAPESEEQVFGIGGASGLVSEWALERNGKPSDSDQYWLVLLVYGDGEPVVGETEGVFYDGKQVIIGGEMHVELDFLLLSAVQTHYNEECVDFGEAYVTGDFLSFETGANGSVGEIYDSGRNISFFYSLPYGYENNVEYLTVKGMLVLPFSMQAEDATGRLYVRSDTSIDEPDFWGPSRAEWRSDACLNLIKDDDSSTKAEISATAVHYLTPEAYNNGWYAEEAFAENADFGDSGICFMVLDFTAKALEDNDGSKSFYVAAVAPEREKMVIGIEEAPTGEIEETLHDGKTTVYGVFKLPAAAGEEKKIRMIFSLRSTGGGNGVRVDLFVSGDEKIYISGEALIGQTVNVPAADFVYELNDDGKSYCVVKCNVGTNFVVIPGALKDGLPVTGIADYAFSGCTGLTSITIPSSVTAIGDYVFDGCSNLASITVESGNTTYRSEDGCLIETASKSLIAGCKTCTIPADGSVTSIGNGAFSGCSGLASIVIPNNVTTIGEGAFRDCSGLTSIVISDNVTAIGNGVFGGCSGLISIAIPDNVTAIGNGVFGGCSGLISIVIPDNVTTIGENAFNGCNSLITIAIPDSVTAIGAGAFSGCGGLTSIVIPDGVVSIGANLFSQCGNLETITIPNSVTSIGNHAFSGCRKLSWIEIPDGVTVIGEYAFNYCSSLMSIEIPAVTIIERGTFAQCSELSSVTISDGTTAIGAKAFSECRNLLSIIIPASVVSVESDAFEYCFGFGLFYGGSRAFWIINLDVHTSNPEVYYYSAEEPTKSGNWWYYAENGGIVIWPVVKQ